jgi:iron complex outermembrane receptor protein
MIVRCLMTVCLVLFFIGTARAEQQVFDIDLPAQAVAESLNSLSEQTGVPVLFPYDLAVDRQAKPVTGQYTLLQALDILLQGTGLSGGLSDKGVVMISTVESVTPNDGGKDMKRESGFFSKLLVSLAAVLTVSTGTAQEGTMSGKGALEEIIVTAQKREQSIQDVSLAITALGQDRLVDAHVQNIQDLQGMAPGLTLGESFGFAQIMVRGIGTDNPFAGGDPSVAMHLDGVVTGQSSAQLGSLFDIQRIEVLRGPQGTLYGRNTTGGSINIITNKPTEEFGGYGRFTAGNYELFQFEGAISGPFSEQLLGRAAVKILDRGGYGENIFNGDDIDDASQQSVRGQLHWLPNDAVDLLVSLEYHREDDNNYMPKFRDGSYLPNPPLPALLPQPIAGTRAADPRDINANALIQNKREQWSLSGTFNWRFNDTFKLVSITNYQEFEKVPQQEFDMTEIAFYVQSEQFETSQFSEELQLHYTGDRIYGLVGLYYYYEEIKSDNRLHQAIPVPPCGPATNTVLDYPITDLCFHFRGAVDAEAAALFANFNFDFTEKITINVGGRYSYETRKGFTDRWIAPGMPAPITFADEGSFNDFTPTVGVQWKPVDDLMLYATYSEGFKSGILLPGQTTPLLEPETLEAYEIGMKGRFFDNRLQLNAAAFSYNYIDLQQGRSVPAGATGFTLVYENAASAEIEGMEVEATWLVTDQFTIDASLTYLDATFSDYITTDPFDTVFAQFGLIPAAPSQQLRGNNLVQAPEWAWTGQAALEAAYKDNVYFTQFNYDALGQDSVTSINANLKFTSADETWALNLWGKNLTDELIYTGTFILNGSRTNAGMLAPPRTFGATLSYNF